MKKKMKMRSAVCMTCLILTVLCGCGKENEADSLIKEIAVHGDFIQYGYAELKETAKVIAEVEVLDDLSTENSRIVSTETGEVIGFYSLRKVKVLDCFKGSDLIPEDAVLEIIDGAARNDNVYLHHSEYEEIKKGQKYIVFLNNDTASGDLSIMSCGNGVVDLETFDENAEYFEIGVKALVEFKSVLPAEEKERILSGKHIKKGNISDISSSQKVLVSIGSEDDQSQAAEIPIYFVENGRDEWIAMIGKD